MQIDNNWHFEDSVTGLKLKVIPGKNLDRLHIENIQSGCSNRDLWFNKEGKFDGTGSAINETNQDQRRTY